MLLPACFHPYFRGSSSMDRLHWAPCLTFNLGFLSWLLRRCCRKREKRQWPYLKHTVEQAEVGLLYIGWFLSSSVDWYKESALYIYLFFLCILFSVNQTHRWCMAFYFEYWQDSISTGCSCLVPSAKCKVRRGLSKTDSPHFPHGREQWAASGTPPARAATLPVETHILWECRRHYCSFSNTWPWHVLWQQLWPSAFYSI